MQPSPRKTQYLVTQIPELIFNSFHKRHTANRKKPFVLIYVDDSKVKQAVNNEDEVETLQDNLDKIYKWEQENNMKFNGGKFQVLRYGPNNELKENTNYFTGNMEDIIEQVNAVKDLGVILSDNAKFEDQIDKVCLKSRQKAGWIMRTFFSRDPEFMRHMFNTLVQPHIDYCSQLWAPPEGLQMQKIENVLRNYTSRIPRLKSLNYWERLKTLRMNSMQRRLDRYKIIYTWKILEDLVPNCGVEVNENERKDRICKVPRHKSKVQSIKTIREIVSKFQDPECSMNSQGS